MPQLIVREIEESIVKKLEARAGLHGVSPEEEHRQILREALLGKRPSRPSFKDFLLSLPNFDSDLALQRVADQGRTIAL
jgi:antitoxin FitA